ncbi:MAG TPA: DUF6412 domain-containing protein [Streptosporangiaceae bacterium]|nr:DUF6412 domain-containing protein [Streptosporangiaceae bacterium]
MGFTAEVVVVLTGLLSALAPLAGLWHGMEHVLFAPSNLSAVAVTLLAGAMLAGALAACLASASLGRLSAVPLIRRAAALREKSWCAAFGSQRDPDAAGRPRPRAPSAAPAAAGS